MRTRDYPFPGGIITVGFQGTSRGTTKIILKVRDDDGHAIVPGTSIDAFSDKDWTELNKNFARRNGHTVHQWGTILDQVRVDVQELALEEIEEREPEAFAPEDISQLPEPLPPSDYWQGLITEGLNASLYGDSGQGKSTIMLGLAIAASLGLPFLGREVTSAPVMFLDWELTRELTLWRLYQIARGMGLAKVPKIFYQSMSDPLVSHMGAIGEWCDNFKPGLVIVDSAGPASGGDPTNHEKAIALANALRKLPTTPLVIDHQSNPMSGQNYENKREFGSSWKRHLTRSSLQVELAHWEHGKSSIVLRHQKLNFGPKSDPIAFHITYGESIQFHMADVMEREFDDVTTLPADQKIERVLNETMEYLTLEHIIEATGIESEKTVSNALGKIKKRRHDYDVIHVGREQRKYGFKR